MSLDEFLGRRRRPGYDCATFARDVWLKLTGIDLADANPGLLAAQFVGRIGKGARRRFVELSAPVEPCLVIMRRPGYSVHVGVYVRGRVIHLREKNVEFQPLHVAARMFKTVQFAHVN